MSAQKRLARRFNPHLGAALQDTHLGILLPPPPLLLLCHLLLQGHTHLPLLPLLGGEPWRRLLLL